MFIPECQTHTYIHIHLLSNVDGESFRVHEPTVLPSHLVVQMRSFQLDFFIKYSREICDIVRRKNNNCEIEIISCLPTFL